MTIAEMIKKLKELEQRYGQDVKLYTRDFARGVFTRGDFVDGVRLDFEVVDVFPEVTNKETRLIID